MELITTDLRRQELGLYLRYVSSGGAPGYIH